MKPQTMKRENGINGIKAIEKLQIFCIEYITCVIYIWYVFLYIVIYYYHNVCMYWMVSDNGKKKLKKKINSTHSKLNEKSNRSAKLFLPIRNV